MALGVGARVEQRRSGRMRFISLLDVKRPWYAHAPGRNIAPKPAPLSTLLPHGMHPRKRQVLHTKTPRRKHRPGVVADIQQLGCATVSEQNDVANFHIVESVVER